ncbi:hypothetical protein BDW62DRAFT_202729 [Aspergillus aurantiobrunneus]
MRRSQNQPRGHGGFSPWAWDRPILHAKFSAAEPLSDSRERYPYNQDDPGRHEGEDARTAERTRFLTEHSMKPAVVHERKDIIQLYGYTDIVRVLLSKGSSAMDTPSHSGQTPLSFAERYKDRHFNYSRDGILQTIWEYLHNRQTAGLNQDEVDQIPDGAV